MPAATWSFNGTLDSDTPGAPSLSAIDPLEQNGFVQESVFGQTQTVYAFDGDSFPATNHAGLVLNTASVLNSDEAFSVELVFTFRSGLNNWRSVLLVNNRTSDDHIYVSPSNQMYVWPAGGGPSTVIPDTYHHLVVVSDGERVRVYLDGTFQFDLSSTALSFNRFLTENPQRLLHLFVDNNTNGVSTEFHDGAIALLRVYDEALSPADALQLSRAAQTNISVGSLGVQPALIPESDEEGTFTFSLNVDNPGQEALDVTVQSSRGDEFALGLITKNQLLRDDAWSATEFLTGITLAPGECISFTPIVRSLAVNQTITGEAGKFCATSFPPEAAASDASDGVLGLNLAGISVDVPAVPTEVLVKFDATLLPTEDDIQDFVNTLGNGFSISGQVPPFYQLTVPTASSATTLLAQLSTLSIRPQIELSNPSLIWTPASFDPATEPLDPSDSDLYSRAALNAVNIPALWNIATGKDQTILVIDTGAASHPDLAVSGESDTNGHGTKVTGVLNALANNGQGIAGVTRSEFVTTVAINDITCPNDLDFLSLACQRGGSTEAKLAAAIRDAAEGPARIVVISYVMPTILSSPPATVPSVAQLVCAELDKLTQRNKIAVVAAGNQGNGLLTYPANCPVTHPARLISVAATGVSSNAGADQLWSGSSFGSWVDISAPGVSIPTTTSVGDYELVTGTSYATPIIAGIVAILMSVPNISIDAIEAALKSTASTTTRRANALAALQSLNEQPFVHPFNITVDEGSSVVFDIGPNVSDANENLYPLDENGQRKTGIASIEVINSPTSGTLSITPSGIATYIHAGDGAISDSFSLRVFDSAGAVSNIANGAIAIIQANDPPTVEINGPAEMRAVLGEEAVFAVNVTDEEGGDFSFEWYVDGELRATYASAQNFVVSDLPIGTVVVEVVVRDGSNEPVSNTFELTISPPDQQVPVGPWTLLALIVLILAINRHRLR